MSPAHAAFLVCAGAVAGVVGTAGGITSLVSYPALLAVGLTPLAANVANIVALVAAWPGSAAASRPELAGRGSWVWRWAPLTVAGGAGGAALLFVTPSTLFARIVPFLVTAASLGLLVQPRLRRLHERMTGAHRGLALGGPLLPIALYNGYFGAGSGVMVLTLLLVVVDDDLARANALKNMLLGAAAVASAVVLVAIAPVHWSAVVPLAAGVLVGSVVGPVVARRIPAGVLRVLVALVGIGLAIELWVTG